MREKHWEDKWLSGEVDVEQDTAGYFFGAAEWVLVRPWEGYFCFLG